MQITEKVQTTIEKRVATVCDLCGARSPQPDSWNPDDHHRDHFELSGSESENYGGDSSGTQTSMDLCPKCFEELIKELKKRNATISIVRW